MALAASEVEHPMGAGLLQHRQHGADALVTEPYPTLQGLLFSGMLDCQRVGVRLLLSC
jgi:hypothetical protein